MTRRTGWLAALLGTAIAASSWLVYRPERVRPRRSKRNEINRLIDPILARAARDADGTEYSRDWFITPAELRSRERSAETGRYGTDLRGRFQARRGAA